MHFSSLIGCNFGIIDIKNKNIHNVQSRNQILCREVDNNKPFKTCNSPRIIAMRSINQSFYRIGNDLPIGVSEGTTTTIDGLVRRNVPTDCEQRLTLRYT